jgi:hypothetical protein
MAYQTANGDILVRDLEGGMETRVSQALRMNASSAWSPDGTRLAHTEGSLVANRDSPRQPLAATDFGALSARSCSMMWLDLSARAAAIGRRHGECPLSFSSAFPLAP